MSHHIQRPLGHGWLLQLGRVDYHRVLGWQRSLVKMRESGMARDTIILVEHPSVFTVGKSGDPEHFAGGDVVPIFIERGGDVTWHGPGQQVVYFVFNLTRRGRDVRRFVEMIQEGIIRTLAEFGVTGTRSEKSVGVWIGEQKIASIGVAVKKWITFHGAAINVSTDLDEFRRVMPCGLDPNVMTSLDRVLGRPVTLKEFNEVLMKKYEAIFGMRFWPVKLDELAEDVKSQTGGGHV